MMDSTTQLLEADRRYLVHPLHHPDDHRQPLVIVEGSGAMLRDAEGREYIDGLSGLWNVNIGHGRGAVVGDAVANLLSKTGYVVTKEFYVNDAGAQVTALAWAAYWRYLQALGSTMTEEAFAEQVPGGLQYRGEYLVPVGLKLAAEYGESLADPGCDIAAPHVWLDIVRDFTVAERWERAAAGFDGYEADDDGYDAGDDGYGAGGYGSGPVDYADGYRDATDDAADYADTDAGFGIATTAIALCMPSVRSKERSSV